HRKPVQRAADLAAALLAVTAPRDVEGVWVDLDHASRLVAVESLDALEAHLNELRRRQLAAAEHARQVGRRQLRQLGVRTHDREWRNSHTCVPEYGARRAASRWWKGRCS